MSMHSRDTSNLFLEAYWPHAALRHVDVSNVFNYPFIYLHFYEIYWTQIRLTGALNLVFEHSCHIQDSKQWCQHYPQLCQIKTEWNPKQDGYCCFAVLIEVYCMFILKGLANYLLKHKRDLDQGIFLTIRAFSRRSINSLFGDLSRVGEKTWTV